jgi:hypothetical protein
MKTMNCSGALMCLFLLLSSLVQAQQLKLGTAPNVIEKSALLDLNSTKQGLLLPRVSDYTVAPLNAAPDGMLIYYVPDKLLYIRKNGLWRKLIDETTAITSVNGQTTSIVSLTTNNIPESVNLYYTDTRARAAFSAGTGINLSGAGVISALNTTALWNASQLQGRTISTNIPANNDVLTWDNTTSTWLPKSNPVGTVTSVALALPSIFTVSGSPVTTSGTLTGTLASQTLRQVFAAPVAANGVPSFRALDPLDIPSGSTNYIQNIAAGTQTANYAISGNGSIGGTLSLPAFTTGSVPFIGASGLVSQKNANFFWDNTNNRLGIGTAAPNNTLEVAGTVAASGLSGLRLKDLGTATVQTYNNKLLSVDASGNVIVTNNPGANNWLVSGNTGNAATAFLGNTDDKSMVIKSNNASFLEFGRRQTLGLYQNITDYSDNDEKVTYVRSALQFEAPSTVTAWRPKMWVNSDGNFRMKGSSANNDYFEFGGTGTNDNGGFEFIIGDNNDEPFIFKSYYYVTAASTEMMRIQGGKVGINMAGATPARELTVNGNVRFTGSVGISDRLLGRNNTDGDVATIGVGTTLTMSSNVLDANASSALWNANKVQGVTVASTAPTTGQVLTYNGTNWVPAAPVAASVGNPTTTITVGATTNTLAVGNNFMVRLIGPTASFTINGISAGADGQMVTLYNTTNNNMILTNLSGATPAGTQIMTNNGATANTNTFGSMTLIYSATDARWLITAINQ